LAVELADKYIDNHSVFICEKKKAIRIKRISAHIIAMGKASYGIALRYLAVQQSIN
jgi:glycosyltransferase involved in cell wall biosynthesis